MSDATLDRSVLEDPATGAETSSDARRVDADARLDRRLKVLESERDGLRRMTRFSGAGFALSIIALVVVLSSLSRNTKTLATGSLSAGEIVLRDGDGTTRGVMGTGSDGGAQLSLSDREGRERIRLTVLADGSPGVTISDAQGRSRAVLGYLPDGTTSLVIADAQGTSRAVVGLEPNGSAHALFTDRAGAVRTVVGVGGDGQPSVSVFDEN
jgi:hypothetical protein